MVSLAHLDDDRTCLQDLFLTGGEESQVGFAIVGFSKMSLLRHQPVPAAAISAKLQDRTTAAFIGKGNGGGNKALSLWTAEHLSKGIGVHIAHFPFVCHVKVAGVDAAVALYHKLDGAATVHAAGLRPLAQQNTDPVVDMPDADIVAFF